MFIVIGLTQDGRMVLHDDTFEEPTEEKILYAAKDFHYQQVFVVDKGIKVGCASQVARYEYDTNPRLKKVDLVQ